MKEYVVTLLARVFASKGERRFVDCVSGLSVYAYRWRGRLWLSDGRLRTWMRYEAHP